MGGVAEVCRRAEVLLSVCPPHASEDVAAEVIATGFRGVYLDANAISPQRAQAIARRMEAAGVSFVDGGIIGGPAWKPRSTWLYLSGPHADTITSCFTGGLLETEIIGNEVGKASALKMCFAAYTKGSTALLSAVVGAADALGVSDELFAQWGKKGSHLAAENEQRVRGVTAKAWRFAGEMEDIAATFDSAGMPDGFHQAAADIYRRMAGFKDAPKTPELDAVIAALQRR